MDADFFCVEGGTLLKILKVSFVAEDCAHSAVQVDQPSANHSLSLSCLEWEVPRELLLHRSELIPPPVLGFE